LQTIPQTTIRMCTKRKLFCKDDVMSAIRWLFLFFAYRGHLGSRPTLPIQNINQAHSLLS